jgi:hypothetical protein
MFYIILMLLEIPLLINFVLDQQSGHIRLLTWLLTVLVTLTRLEFGLAMMGLTLCWFEIPLLRLGYPNQFLSDIVILGLMTGSFAHRRCRTAFKIFDFDWIRHPIALALALVAPLALGQIIVSMIELHSVSANGWSLRSMISVITTRLYNWDIERDFLHRFSAVHALFLQLVAAIFFAMGIKYQIFHAKLLIRAFILGVHGTAIYAACQIFGLLPVIYTVDIGGTLQNGNLLSFVGALALFGEIYLITHRDTQNSTANSAYVLLSCSLSIFALIAGVGRISWLGSIIAMAMFLPVVIKEFQIYRRLLNPRSVFIVLICSLGIGLIYFSLRNVGSMIAASEELLRVLRSNSFWAIISAGGRMEHYTRAWGLWQENLIEGIGLDAFYLRGGVGLDIHNLALKWGTELGLFGFLIAIIAILSAVITILRIWLKLNLKNTSIAALAVAALAPALGDSTLNYKSLLLAATLCTLPLTAAAYELRWPLQSASRKFKAWVGMGSCIFCFLAGFLTMSKPQILVNYYGGYGSEPDVTSPSGSNSWRPLATVLPLTSSAGCHEFAIRPLIASHHYTFKIAPISSVAKQLSGVTSLAELAEHEESLGSRLRHFEKIGGQWHKICVCMSPGTQAKELYLRSEEGDMIGFAKAGLGPDQRFVSYGLAANPTPVNPNLHESSCMNL